MKLRRPVFLFLVVGSYLYAEEESLADPIFYQQPVETPPVAAIAYQKSVEEPPVDPVFYQQPAYLSLRLNEGKGIGYDRGYSTAEALIFPDMRPHVLPFIDLRLHHFYNNNIALNTGVGARIVADSLCKIFGFNLYYDFRSTHQGPYHQLGAGLELMGQRWVLRLNGYLPVGDKMGLICSRTERDGDFFIKKKCLEVALKGANLEAQVRISRLDPLSVDLYGGPYIYEGESCRHVIGGQLGLRVRAWKWLSLGFSGTYDTVYNARLQGEMALTIPLGSVAVKKDSKSRCNFVNKILKQMIRRNEIIVLDKKCEWEWNY